MKIKICTRHQYSETVFLHYWEGESQPYSKDNTKTKYLITDGYIISHDIKFEFQI